jgi:SepF-like predicted cell division protein (DUF552 family)
VASLSGVSINMVKKFLKDLKKRFDMSTGDTVQTDEQYVELSGGGRAHQGKILVRPYVLEDFSDIKNVVDALRGRETIVLLNIGPLKEKDLVELKRAINKLKKTVDAIGGDIAGFGDDYIVAAPEYAEIFRQPQKKKSDEDEL